MASTGEKVPDFTLTTFEREEFTPQSIFGRRSLFCFYPNSFSGVCTSQFEAYEAEIEEFKARGVDIYAISVDSSTVQNAFKEHLGVEGVTFLSDFEPKGATAKAFDTYLDDYGFNNRSVFEIEADGTIGWAITMPTPAEFPDAATVLAGLDG